jgi:hypothetical protein
MSGQIQHSRLSRILRDHFLVLIRETLTKLKVVFLFSCGFDLEQRSIIQNCLEIDDTWFCLKNHLTQSSIRNGCENIWFDQKCQLNFLVNQVRGMSDKFSSRLDVENVKNLRACLQIMKSIVDAVSLNDFSISSYIEFNISKMFMTFCFLLQI